MAKLLVIQRLDFYQASDRRFIGDAFPLGAEDAQNDDDSIAELDSNEAFTLLFDGNCRDGAPPRSGKQKQQNLRSVTEFSSGYSEFSWHYDGQYLPAVSNVRLSSAPSFLEIEWKQKRYFLLLISCSTKLANPTDWPQQLPSKGGPAGYVVGWQAGFKKPPDGESAFVAMDALHEWSNAQDHAAAITAWKQQAEALAEDNACYEVEFAQTRAEREGTPDLIPKEVRSPPLLKVMSRGAEELGNW